MKTYHMAALIGCLVFITSCKTMDYKKDHNNYSQPDQTLINAAESKAKKLGYKSATVYLSEDKLKFSGKVIFQKGKPSIMDGSMITNVGKLPVQVGDFVLEKGECAIYESGNYVKLPGNVSQGEPKLNKYMNDEFHLSFTYPTSWTVMTPEEVKKRTMGLMNTSNAIVFVTNELDYDQNVNITSSVIPKKYLTTSELRQVEESMDRRYPKSFAGFKKVSSKILTISGVKALEYVMDNMQLNKRFRQKFLMIVKDGKNNIITFTAPRDSYVKADEECFQTMISTIIIQ